MTRRKGSGFLILRVFREAGYTPAQIESICKGEKRAELRVCRMHMFPAPPAEHGPASHILVQKVEEVLTYGALEDLGDEGFGAVHSRLMMKCIDNNIVYVGDLAALTERDARRILGRPSSKTYRAVEALLALYGLRIGMELPDRH